MSHLLLPSLAEANASALWTCCFCAHLNEIYTQDDVHPLGTLYCFTCRRKPCRFCVFSGAVKALLPNPEPFVTTLPADTSIESYGIICVKCGVSWRAKRMPRLKKMPSHVHRSSLAPSLGLVRRSQSMMETRRKATAKTVEGKSALIRFSGIKCTCGQVSDDTTISFKVQEEPVLTGPYTPAMTLRLHAQGHDSSVIRIRRIEHPNPLRIAPVLPDSWEEALSLLPLEKSPSMAREEEDDEEEEEKEEYRGCEMI